jgi:hypothetical protein
MKRTVLNRSDLRLSEFCFSNACRVSREHSTLAAKALAKYGDHGAPISGCVRDHFPEHVKAELRLLAATVTSYSDAAWKHRPRRVRTATMRSLSRAVAARDGSGFYGPQA